MLVLETVKCYHCSTTMVIKVHLPLISHLIELRCRHCRRHFTLHIVTENNRLIYSYLNRN